MQTIIAVCIGRLVRIISRFFGWGSGDTWSGEIALRINPSIIQKLRSRIGQVIIVAGTNGKTTTTAMLKTLLGDTTFSNTSGANLLNGIAGSLIHHVSLITLQQKVIAIMEVDEASLPAAMERLNPDAVVLLNLFRDQLDRYGEVTTIARKWHEALVKLPASTTVILNADDPQVAFLGKKLAASVRYIGMKKATVNNSGQGELWGDSLYCPSCGIRLVYRLHIFSHLGNWECRSCGLKRPTIDVDASEIQLPIEGLHNQYNAAAAMLAASIITHQPVNTLTHKLANFTPAFGRMETFTLSNEQNCHVQILLSKNPTGLNENIRLLSTKTDVGVVLLVLNDRIPDGTDVSWIWDVDFEPLMKQAPLVVVSGDRAYDMAIRMKYQSSKLKAQNQNSKFQIFKSVREAIACGIRATREDKTLYVFPTYSAMLEVRQILLGRKIL